QGADNPVKVLTPGKKTIEEVVEFLGGDLKPERALKSLLYRAGGDVVLVLVRGDRAVNETKLARFLKVGEVTLASDDEVEQATGAAVGFAGPVGFKGRIVADKEVTNVLDGVTGANQTDHHLVHVQYGRDFTSELGDIRQVGEGDSCARCGGILKMYRSIEGGH